MLSLHRLALAATYVLSISTAAEAVVLFSDNFNTAGSSTNYTEVSSGQTAVTYAFNYSALGIPAAPKTTDASTLGVKFEANMNAGAVAGVTLHTTQQFSGAYVVKFDGWINANGPFPAGGTGSTEFLTAGVGADGTTVNRLNATGSGGWTAVDGEGQSTIDYRLLKAAALQGVTTGQYAAGTQAAARAATDPYYAQFGNVDVAALPVQGANNVPNPGSYAQQSGTTIPGTFGFEWHEVELRVNPTGGTGGATAMDWYIDGLRIGTLDAGIGTFPTDGRVTIGYNDPFASVSDNAALSFGLIDNLSVSTIGNTADFNGNTQIDAADYPIWRKNNGLTSGATQADGDANGDGMANQTDYDLWRASFGNTVPGSGLGPQIVPEPTTLILFVLGIAAMCVRRATKGT